MSYKFLIMGPPGAGKGTQAKRIASAYRKHGMIHVSTGDILRDAAEKKTPAGLEYLAQKDNGGFVRDDTVARIVDEQLRAVSSYILDGFPRNEAQAEMFDISRVNHIIVLESPDAVVYARMRRRLVCSDTKCGATYGELIPPKERNACDACHKPLTTRPDDDKKALDAKIAYFNNHTKPAINRYHLYHPEKITVIDGTDWPDNVSMKIARKLMKAGFTP
jgi:adenylate kinase